ncbi:MAG: PD40 domain-containing protein, partial [Caldilineaceae bacterium]|nr:PD40 domain-containing protein [Caldilineaceae bacterium]
QRHTDHEDYYVRNPSSDGKRIVYHAGADLYVYDPARDIEFTVPVAYHSPRVQRNRKFVSAARYLQSVKLHPTGLAVAATTRGKSFAFYNFEGPVIQMGKRDGVRYRLTEWLNDGRRMVAVSDEPGEEVLEIFSADPEEPSRRLDELDIGRVHSLKVSPIEDKVALVNHRYELLIVDLEEETLTLVERSPYRNIGGFDWSPDGRWLAYSCATSPQTTAIRLYQLPEEQVRHPAELPTDAVDADAAAVDGGDSPDTAPDAAGPSETAGDGAADEPEADAGSTVPQGQIYTITQPVLNDIAPAFDPRGRYLYFLSYREFNPVYDGLHFDLGFPWGMRPYLITLQDSLPNPFMPRPDMEDADGDDA